MNFFESLKSPRVAWLVSLGTTLIITYPNINALLWGVLSPAESQHHATWDTAKAIYFIYRYLFYSTLLFVLIRLNIRLAGACLKARLWKSFMVTASAYILYVLIGLTVDYHTRTDCFTQLVILQFIIAWLAAVLIGQIYNLTVLQREKEREIERLRTENLQSRVDALSNQINPHFFFNSLNGLTALVAAKRYDETTHYIAKLSNIFRYILQSDKKELVTVEEELKFLEAYRYLLEIRYSGKISFCIQAEAPDRTLQLPVLSLLPLMENIVKHNIIDSDHLMCVEIRTTGYNELVVTNPVFPKLVSEESNGIGLSNLAARYRLLTDTEIRICETEKQFTVVLPLLKSTLCKY